MISTWLVHEFAHWSTGELLGLDMAMTLNGTHSTDGHPKDSHETLISAAGPIITLLQAIVFYFLLKKSDSGSLLFPFLLTPLYMRTLAGIMNIINLNDEGRISRDLGLGSFTLPVLMFVVLFYLGYDVVKTRKLNTRVVIITTLLIMLFSSILILSDQAFTIRLL